jgi:hypothetical protein
MNLPPEGSADDILRQLREEVAQGRRVTFMTALRIGLRADAAPLLRLLREAATLRSLPRLAARNKLAVALLVGSIAPLIIAHEAKSFFVTPKPLSLAEAVASVQSEVTRYVTLDARPDTANKFYNVPGGPYDLPHIDYMLSRFSPADGIPINGPDAAVKPAYVTESLLGTRARVDGPLTSYGYVEQSQWRGLVRSRWYISVSGRIMGLQGPLVVARFTELNVPFVDLDERFAIKFKNWLAQGRWSGTVERCCLDVISESAAFSAYERDVPFDIRSNSVIDTTEPARRDGVYFFMPFRDSSEKVWLQVPIDLANWQQNKFTGLFLPARSHRFTPEGSRERVALLSLAPEAIGAYIDQQWQIEWQVAVALAELIAFAGLLVIIVNEGRPLLFKPGVPEYLAPFAPYLAPQPVDRSFALAALGAVMTIVGGIATVLGVIAAKAGEFKQDTPIAAVEYLVGWGLVAGIGLKFYQMGRGIWSRGAAQVLQDDRRSPVVYLRSFRADSRWYNIEDKLVEAAAKIGPVVAVGEPGEHFPPLGAARLYVDHAHWHDVVARLVAVAQLIIFRVRDTEGFWWELRHVVETIDPAKVLIWIPGDDRRKFDDALIARLSAALGHSLPPVEQSRGAAFIAFGPGWRSAWVKTIPGTQ